MRGGPRCSTPPAVVVAVLIAGCAAPPRTSRLTVEDLVEVSDAMAASLTHSDAIAARSPASEPWYVSVDKVLNLTSDVIPVEEQWAVMHRIRSSPAMQELWDGKRVALVIPPEKVRALERELAGEPPAGGLRDHRRATHTLAATFRSATRAGERARTDLYVLEFDLFRLGDGVPVWTDRFELKRQALGKLLD